MYFYSFKKYLLRYLQTVFSKGCFLSGSFSDDSEMLAMVNSLVSERLWSEPIHCMLI